MSQFLDLLGRHLAAENAHDLEGTLATLTTDCLFEDLTLARFWSGHAGAAEHYTMWWSAFDTQVTGERLHLGVDSAAAETTWQGEHIGEFLGIPATGRPIRLSIAVCVDFDDGLMSAERFYWDSAELAAQLGVDPGLLHGQRSHTADP